MFLFRNKKLPFLYLRKNNLIILILLIIFLYFINSVLFSRNIFSNHVLLLLHEASQLLSGNTPYKEINIHYGIGTPLINAFSLLIFGKNIFSIFLMTNIFYFLSIFFILLIFLKFKFSFVDNLFFILILINVHPATELPWSSYLSFFPIVLSLYFILQKKKKHYFLSGLCLALACLIRETVLLSAGIIFFYVIIESFFFKKKNFNNLKFYILGFFIPLTIFVVYMIISSNYLIWIELGYPLYRWQSLINIGYYIKNDLTPLRKFYIFFLAPYREIFLTFLKSITYLWINWLLIFISYFCCILIFCKLLINNSKSWEKDESTKYKVGIISVYGLSLILQNMHIPAISRIACGSIISMLTLFYFLNKICQDKKIRFSIYTVIIILLFFNSKGVFPEKNISGLNNFYEESFANVKNITGSFSINKQDLDKKPKIIEFKNMNYEQSTHKFYNDLIKVCEELRVKRGIKYLDNQTFFWELPYFCKTKPKYYYVLTLANFLEENFKKSKMSKSYDSNNHNTIAFYVSDNINLKETTYFDINGFAKKRKIENLNILYRFDLKKDYPEVFRYYQVRFLFITQSYVRLTNIN